jgi:hypothetical protein
VLPLGNELVIKATQATAGALELVCDYEGAESLHRQSLKQRELQVGPDHEDLIEELEGLAEVVTKRRRFDEAWALWVRVLRMEGERCCGGRANDARMAAVLCRCGENCHIALWTLIAMYIVSSCQ